MQFEIHSENSFARKVNVTVPAGDVRSELDRAYRSVAKNARLPGFRQGKVPRKVLEANFGPRVEFDVANALIQKAWTNVLADEKLDVVSQPSIVDQAEVSSGSDFTFTIAVEVRPDVTVDSYKGLSVYWPTSEVTDEEVESAVKARLAGASKLAEVTDRAVEEGDYAQVQLVVKDGDDEIANEPGTMIRTGGDGFYAGIESFLVGMSIDEEKSGKVTFAENASNADVAGRELDVEAKLLAVQALETPDIAEFAKEKGFDDEAAFRASITEELGKGREEAARNQARANLLDKLIEANTFEVPGGMIEENLQMLLNELRRQQSYMGRDPREVSFTNEQVAFYRTRAEFAAKGALILEAVMKAEDIEVTDDEVNAKIAELAASQGQTEDAIRGFIARQGEAQFKDQILEEKTLDWLLDQSEISHDAPEAEAAAEE